MFPLSSCSLIFSSSVEVLLLENMSTTLLHLILYIFQVEYTSFKSKRRSRTKDKIISVLISTITRRNDCGLNLNFKVQRQATQYDQPLTCTNYLYIMINVHSTYSSSHQLACFLNSERREIILMRLMAIDLSILPYFSKASSAHFRQRSGSALTRTVTNLTHNISFLISVKSDEPDFDFVRACDDFLFSC